MQGDRDLWLKVNERQRISLIRMLWKGPETPERPPEKNQLRRRRAELAQGAKQGGGGIGG